MRLQILWNTAAAAAAAMSLQSCPTLCDPIDGSPLGSSVPGILQATILGWGAIASSRDLPDPGIRPATPASPALAGRFFTSVPPVVLGQL